MTDDDDRPELLRILFPRKPAKGSAAPAPVRHSLTSDDVSRYASAALDHEVDAILRAGEGTRNRTLNTAGFSLSQLVAGGYLPHDLTWDTLRDAALTVGLTPHETDGTLRSSFRAGQAQPRRIPDRPDLVYPSATVLPFARPAFNGIDGVDGMDADTNGLGDSDDDDDPVDIESLFPRLDWRALWDDDTVDEWLLYPLIPARRLVALFSPPKVGKSLLMLEVAVGIARGDCEVLGAKLAEGRKVLYVDFENDPRGDIRSRLQAMGRTPEELENLVYLSFPSLAYLDTVMGGLQLEAVAKHYGVELVVIDTISRAVQGEENANDTWLSFYRNTGVRLKNAGIACVRLDHTGKDESKGMRGGSAKNGDVDAAWQLSAVSDDLFVLECTANRLPIGEKRLAIRRHVAPLRHAVETNGLANEYERKRAAALLAIQALDPPWPKVGHGSGIGKLWPVVEHTHAGIGYHAFKDALKDYKDAPGTTTLD